MSISYFSTQNPLGPIANTGAFPFTFGVPFTAHLHLDAFAGALCCAFGSEVASGASAYAEFDALRIELPGGTDAQNATVIEAAATPEPSSFPLLLGALGILWARARTREKRSR